MRLKVLGVEEAQVVESTSASIVEVTENNG